MGRRSGRWARLLATILGFVLLVAGSIGIALEGNPIGYVGVLLFVCAPLVLGAGAVMDARRSRPRARGLTYERGTLAGAAGTSTTRSGWCSRHGAGRCSS